jgi:hypothetical protein
MKFVVVNGRTPHQQTRCALCCEPIGKSYLRELTTQYAQVAHPGRPLADGLNIACRKSFRGSCDDPCEVRKTYLITPCV